MKLIAQVKLNPTPKQHAALLATLKEANAACDVISAAAWQACEFRRLPLQKLVYHDIKASFHLGAQIVMRCIAKVTDAYKLDRKVQRTFQSHGALAFDDRNLTWYTDTSAVSIWTLQGRQYIPRHRDTFGDLVACDGLDQLAAGADLLIQCCLFAEQEMIDPATNLLAQHVMATAAQAGQIAARAGVRTLVLTHFDQKPREVLEAMVADVRRAYPGEVRLAEDLMTITL